MRRVAVLSVAVMALAACGGDDDSSSDSTAEATEPTEPPEGGAEPTPVDATSEDASTTAAETSAPDDTTTPDDTTESTSSGEIGEDETAYVDALIEDYDGPGEDVVECLAEAIIKGVGLARLQSAGVSPQALVDSSNLSELGLAFDDPAAVESAVVGCGDGYLVLALTGTETTPEAQACADEHVNDEIVARVVVASFSGEEPDANAQAAAGAFEACLEEASSTSEPESTTVTTSATSTTAATTTAALPPSTT